MSSSELEARPKQKVERREETTRPGAYFQPAVDIFETSGELVVVADMPGVPPDGLNVHLEGDQLSIEGRVREADYEGLKPLYVEYGVGGFYRRFTLGEMIDRDGIKAQMKNGVLVLKLPKRRLAIPQETAQVFPARQVIMLVLDGHALREVRHQDQRGGQMEFILKCDRRPEDGHAGDDESCKTKSDQDRNTAFAGAPDAAVGPDRKHDQADGHKHQSPEADPRNRPGPRWVQREDQGITRRPHRLRIGVRLRSSYRLSDC